MEIYKVKLFGKGEIEYYAVASLIELTEEMEEVAKSIKFICDVDATIEEINNGDFTKAIAKKAADIIINRYVSTLSKLWKKTLIF